MTKIYQIEMRLFIIICFTSSSFCYGQSNYLLLPKSSTLTITYRSDADSFKVRFYKPIDVNGLKYYMRIRDDWSGKDTAYFREDKNNYYACTDLKQTYDYIEIPKKPKQGQVWYNIDSSWTYTILSADAKLETPVKNYEHLVAIEAKQPTEKNNLYSNYINYYAKGIGHVASVVDGKLYVYFVDIIKE